MNDIPSLIDNCALFYQTELKRHNDAGHPLNVLLFLIDNNLIEKDKLKELNTSIIDNDFTVNMNIPVSFGGTGKPINTWIMCDLPLTLYISIKLNGNKVTKKHKSFIDEIANRMEPNGWRCSNKGNIGKFRGPGKKDDECPIATLNVLKLLTVTKDDEYIEQKQKGIQTIENLWNDRKKRKAYLFGMGTDFMKIKYPMIWYDILNAVNVLSYYPDAIKTEAFNEMFEIIRRKIETNNYTPESVYQYWKGYDFGQKKSNSEYIERTIKQIEKRIQLTTAST
ncbi:MAG: hypothetical protein GX421_09010 [Caldisericales bacterium]|nr:hypothetical protein [Caldisericales bacterium]